MDPIDGLSTNRWTINGVLDIIKSLILPSQIMIDSPHVWTFNRSTNDQQDFVDPNFQPADTTELSYLKIISFKFISNFWFLPQNRFSSFQLP